MITKDDAMHIADIAMLNFSDEEIDILVEKFDEVSGFINKISEADIENVKPLFQVNEDIFAVRNGDEGNTTLTNEEVLQNTKEKKYGYFKILKVVE